ncbi:hypothetical protein [Mycobacterium paraense]|uniref:hypothetical protein n=1 Tax=Mycobacterium paraense TaxID=767916 RepID=UPI001154A225|nr:hypothetical protein [Mycobacterium paraense]
MDRRHQSAPDDAPGDTPTPRKGVVVLLAAVACTVLGAKLIAIWALGSPVPLVDQWDGEAAGLYSPYLRGTLSLGDLFAAHNEHRIFVFRVLALVHLELAGEWNTRLEMILGAIVHTAAITWLAALLVPLVAPQRRIILAAFIALAFALPIGFENELSGFQTQVYLSLLFGIAAVVAFAYARPFSARWFGGLAAAVLSYFSFATGVAAALVAAALVGLQMATGARRRCGREFAGVAVVAALVLAAILWSASTAKQMNTPWTLVQGLLLVGGQVIVGLVPMIWFCRRTVSRRPALSDRAWLAVGISMWLVIQLALLAYGRGAALAVRYMDIVLLVYPVGLMAILALFESARASRFGRYAGPGAVTWVFVVVAALALLGYVSAVGAIGWGESARQQVANVQTYFATRNVDDLKATGGRGHMFDLSYPNSRRLAAILADPGVRGILPHEVRPADGDNAAARSHMWLKGALADITASSVHVVLSSGPVILSVGLGLFFAVGARRSFPHRRRAPDTPRCTSSVAA